MEFALVLVCTTVHFFDARDLTGSGSILILHRLSTCLSSVMLVFLGVDLRQKDGLSVVL